jgi:hypothetical protein
MATETNGETTIYDVLFHTGRWENAVNVSSAHEENNFKITIKAGGIANGDSADQVLECPICIPDGFHWKNGSLDSATLTFELMQKVNRLSGAWSETPKTLRDGVVYIEDASGLRFTLPFEIGDVAVDDPNDDRVVVRSRGRIVGSRKGDEQPGSLTMTLHFTGFTDGT